MTLPENKVETDIGRKAMDDFAQRSGIDGDAGDSTRRYLWTDAFAVQSFFGLSHIYASDKNFNRAFKLIQLVHEHLGKHHPKDERTGWISGLPEEEGEKHPTITGLRIGKNMPEREPTVPFNERLEWERDGQYFHYITRWIDALLQAHQETNDRKYAVRAAELMKATEKFFYKSGRNIRMYWKMSVDLSRPLVTSMGALDPLEGYMCAKSISNVLPDKAADLEGITRDLEMICEGRDWSTTDALGMGGLLLNTVRSAVLSSDNVTLIDGVRPEQLLTDALSGLHTYASQIYSADQPPEYRLAFRECGLALGLRVLSGFKNKGTGLNLEVIQRFLPLAEDIENFWVDTVNQKASTWANHLDINQVSLASSLIAKVYPYSFY
jgi:hypothetical protein